MSSFPLKNAIEELNEAFEAFKEANDERLKAIEKTVSGKTHDPLVEEKLDRLNKAVEEATERVRKLSLLEQRPSFANTLREINIDDHVEAFFQYLVNGKENGLRQLEQKRLQPGALAEGGYLLPSSIVQAVDEGMKALSPMRSLATVVQTSRHQYELVIDDGTRNLSHWGEPTAQQRLEGTATPRLNKILVPAFTLFDMPRISATLLEDTLFNLEKWLVDLISKNMARKENQAFINGDGVTQPRGVLNLAPSLLEEQDRLQVLRTGVEGGFPGANPDEILINLVHLLRPEYLKDAVWMMPRSVLAQIRKMKGNDGHYLWHPDVAPSQTWSAGGRLFGYPVVICDDIPGLTAGTRSVSILFGNFHEGYVIADRLGTSVLRDPYSAKPDVDLLVRRRVGGNVKDHRAIKGIQFSAEEVL